MGGGRGGRAGEGAQGGTLKQEVGMEGWWREEVKNLGEENEGGKDEEGRKRIKKNWIKA